MMAIATVHQGLNLPARSQSRHRQGESRVARAANAARQLISLGIGRHAKHEPAAFPAIVVAHHGDARAAGAALAALHDRLAHEGVSNVAVVRAALRHFGLREHARIARMALDLAAQADAMGRRNPYHNAGHLREVTVNMVNLAALNATGGTGVTLGKKDLTLAIAAAVSHDLDHDGTTNDVSLRDAVGQPIINADGKPAMANVPFLLEDRSIALIDAAGRRAGVSEADLRRLHAVILITDPNTGYHTLDAALDANGDPAQKAAMFARRSELALLDDRATLRIAAMLRDADLLGSCGTSASENDRETARLERERGMPAGGLRGGGTEYFIGTIARGRFLSPEGQFFQGNLDHLRALNFARLHTVDPRQLTLAEMETRT